MNECILIAPCPDIGSMFYHYALRLEIIYVYTQITDALDCASDITEYVPITCDPYIWDCILCLCVGDMKTYSREDFYANGYLMYGYEFVIRYKHHDITIQYSSMQGLYSMKIYT